MVKGTFASELRTRFWPTRFTYSVTTGSLMNLAELFHFLRELLAQRDLVLERIEIQALADVAIADGVDVLPRCLF